jgi:hypothetical protein
MALAPLPIKKQIAPGLALLAMFPVLLIWLARDYGALPVLLCVAAAVSVFRNPLREGLRAIFARFSRD